MPNRCVRRLRRWPSLSISLTFLSRRVYSSDDWSRSGHILSISALVARDLSIFAGFPGPFRPWLCRSCTTIHPSSSSEPGRWSSHSRSMWHLFRRVRPIIFLSVLSIENTLSSVERVRDTSCSSSTSALASCLRATRVFRNTSIEYELQTLTHIRISVSRCRKSRCLSWRVQAGFRNVVHGSGTSCSRQRPSSCLM